MDNHNTNSWAKYKCWGNVEQNVGWHVKSSPVCWGHWLEKDKIYIYLHHGVEGSNDMLAVKGI